MYTRFVFVFFFQAEDGIRDLVRSRGLGDVYKRQPLPRSVRDARRAAATLRNELPAEPPGHTRRSAPALSLIHI